jgi:hypothetical protein
MDVNADLPYSSLVGDANSPRWNCKCARVVDAQTVRFGLIAKSQVVVVVPVGLNRHKDIRFSDPISLAISSISMHE